VNCKGEYIPRGTNEGVAVADRVETGVEVELETKQEN